MRPVLNLPGIDGDRVRTEQWRPAGARTIYQVLEESAAQFGDAPALLQPTARNDGQRDYLTYSWNQSTLRLMAAWEPRMRRIRLIRLHDISSGGSPDADCTT